jgi:hypothetical protein
MGSDLLSTLDKVEVGDDEKDDARGLPALCDEFTRGVRRAVGCLASL